METKRILMVSSSSIPAPIQPDEVGHKSEPTADEPTIPEAANELGIDAFCMYGLIQLGAVQPERASSGRLFLRQPQMKALVQGLPEDSQPEDFIC